MRGIWTLKPTLFERMQKEGLQTLLEGGAFDETVCAGLPPQTTRPIARA